MKLNATLYKITYPKKYLNLKSLFKVREDCCAHQDGNKLANQI